MNRAVKRAIKSYWGKKTKQTTNFLSHVLNEIYSYYCFWGLFTYTIIYCYMYKKRKILPFTIFASSRSAYIS